MKHTWLMASLALAVSPLVAQDFHRLTISAGGGFTEPAGVSGRRLDPGFNFQFAGGANITKHAGIEAEFGYNQLGVASTVLQDLGIPDGRARIYSFTLDPVFRLAANKRFEVYVKGGAGLYRRTVEFTQPTIERVTVFDPFYGVFFPAAVPTNLIVGSFTQNKAGWNVGGGFAVSVKGDSKMKFFAESRYHYMYSSPVRTMYLPVTFGLRW